MERCPPTATAALVTPTPHQPTDIDVLSGRGRIIQIHGGNIRLRKLVLEYKQEFEQSSNDGSKKKVVTKVFEMIKYGIPQLEVRFLKKNKSPEVQPGESGVKQRTSCVVEEKWEELSNEEAMKKVHHALRGKSPKLTHKEMTILKATIDHMHCHLRNQEQYCWYGSAMNAHAGYAHPHHYAAAPLQTGRDDSMSHRRRGVDPGIHVLEGMHRGGGAGRGEVGSTSTSRTPHQHPPISNPNPRTRTHHPEGFRPPEW